MCVANMHHNNEDTIGISLTQPTYLLQRSEQSALIREQNGEEVEYGLLGCDAR
jgi:hypothetical protein